MADKWGFKPKFDITVTVRDVTHNYAHPVGIILGKAMGEIKELAQLSRPREGVETAIELAQTEPSLEDMKHLMIKRAMEKTNGNKIAAAKLLGISPRMVYRWIGRIGEGAIENE